MTVEQIVDLVVSTLPSLIAVLTTVGLVIKTIKEFTTLKQQVVDMKAIEDVRCQLKNILEENIALKKTLNQTMTKIDRIDRSNMHE